MSTQTFSTRSTPPRNHHPQSSGERRRQWLRQRGLLSAHNGPSRRLASLLPRKNPLSPSSSRATASHQHSSAQIHLERHQNTVPVVVAKPSKPDNDDQQPSATRSVSMYPDDSPRLRTGTFRSRSNHRRWKPKDFDSIPSPQSRSRRLLNRLKRKPRQGPSFDSPVRVSASIDVPRTRDREVERVSLHRHSLDRKRNFSNTDPASRPKPRAVYTVFDRELPRHVLQGNSRYEKTSWNDYHERIDELAEDPQFMDYLTAPVQRRPLTKANSGQTNPDPKDLAVNKLYPLAFIRLLEAHASHDAESDEPSDPQEEEHRYDDVDREDEGRIERTVSNGMYDMGRFRAVGGPRGGSASSRSSRQHLNYRSPKFLEGRGKADVPPYHSRLFSRISRDSDVVSVPVC